MHTFRITTGATGRYPTSRTGLSHGFTKKEKAMVIKVLYHSRSGNTRKLAEAIAEAVSVTAEALTPGYTLTEPVDMLFLGDGIYCGTISGVMKHFTSGLDGTLVKQAAVFGTYGGQRKGMEKLKRLLGLRNVQTRDEVFGCKGQSWLIINRARPNGDDLHAAADFARRCIDKRS